MIDKINAFLSCFDYDVRKTNNARFIDQKVTPDVLYIVSNCVLEHARHEANQLFSTKDIWESEFANEEVKNIFNKPDVLNSRAKSEYDKFFAQPLKMLEYSKLLKVKKIGSRNYYSISNYSILEFISFRERNCLLFITLYLKKVLSDSSVWPLFDGFFKKTTKENFKKLIKICYFII